MSMTRRGFLKALMATAVVVATPSIAAPLTTKDFTGELGRLDNFRFIKSSTEFTITSVELLPHPSFVGYLLRGMAVSTDQCHACYFTINVDDAYRSDINLRNKVSDDINKGISDWLEKKVRHAVAA